MSSSKITDIFEQINQKETLKKVFFYENNSNKVTYQELAESSNKILYLLKENNLAKGDKIILSTKNDYYTSLFFITFLRYGIVTVLLDPDVKKERALSIIKKTNPKGFVMDDDLFASRNITTSSFQLKIKNQQQKKGKLFNKLIKKKPLEVIDKDFFPAILNQIENATINIEPVLKEDIAYIIFTSGTTSEPKGVVISHHNLFSHLETLTKVYSLNKHARILNILMLYHADGSIQGPLLSLFNTATWIRPFTFDIAKIGNLFNSIYKLKVTHFITVPTMLSFMNRFKENYEDSFETDEFESIISVASKLEKELWLDFEKTFSANIMNVYGLTETVAGSLFCNTNEPSKKGTIGIPLDCEAKIVKSNGELAQINEKGVLMLKGNHIFKGYLNDSKATELVLQDGWFNTGDITIKDEDGYFKIVGREKNTINSGGINVYPEQVTEMINLHPKITQSVCVGIPDETFGEKLVAAVVKDNNEEISELELTEFLRPLLEQNQIPKEFFFFDDLPKGISGKIITKEVVNNILSQKSNSITSKKEANYEDVIKSCAADAFNININKISMKDSSNSIDGWDSMGHLVFVTALEKKFNVRFSTAEMMIMNTLSNTKTILARKLK